MDRITEDRGKFSLFLHSELPSLYCLVSEGPVNRGTQLDAGSRSDYAAARGGDPLYGHLLQSEEEEKVAK